MKVEYAFTYHATLKEPVMVGPGPYGTRAFYEVIGGRLEGEGLKGNVLTGGGDWLLIGPDGWGRLDVRAQFITDDGAAIYLSYYGVLEMNEQVQQAIAAGHATDYGDLYFRTNPRFETGDPRYAWLNHTVFVAEGRVLPGPTVEYRVYRVL
ncbi:MAG: DUF3237 domain-containing protein [Deltaproteobacteria bacterium]|nr:DUF3237 domain-containing protein [Deltaproteobacteria bacterium]